MTAILSRCLACWIFLFLGKTMTGASLEWETIPGGRRLPLLSPPQSQSSGFQSVSPLISGINFTNRLSEDCSLTNQIFLNGSGVSAGDIDGDGWVDLYFCGLDSPNSLWRNRGGWHFENITTEAGVACANQASTGSAFVDIDGDGDLDLLVNGIQSGTRLFINDGQGKFQETTRQSGLASRAGSTSMTLADIDGDGLLDLYVVNYRNDTLRDQLDKRFRVGVTNGFSRLLSVNGRSVEAPDLLGRYTLDQADGILENGEADTLYHNDGGGHFTPVPWNQGAFLDEKGKPILIPYDWGLSARFRDMNGDNFPDLYVCNDFQSPDRIWMNKGNGIFQALPKNALRQTSLFSMGIDFADVNRDGLDDFFVADMLSRDHRRRQVQVMGPTAFAQVRNLFEERPQFPRNTLFLNRDNQAYSEIAQLSGVDASEWSWCPAFLDVDLDGYEDLLVTTGHWRDAQHADIAQQLDDEAKRLNWSPSEQLRQRKRLPRLDTPNIAFRNRGDLTFEEIGAPWGFDSRRISHGMALADLDLDGDLDVIVNCLNDAPLILENRTTRARIAIKLNGLPPNTRGVGAKISVLALGLPQQSQEMMAGGRYLSSDDFIRTFAAGNSTNRLTLTIAWRSGAISIVSNALPNYLYEINEKSAFPINLVSLIESKKTTPLLASSHSSKPKWFEDFSDRLPHQHYDPPFDDFARQPLLPHQLSHLGPGVTWFDFNGDGWDDLIIGTGREGRLSVFRNNTQGTFVPQRAKPLEPLLEADLTTVLAWHPSPTNSVLLLGLSQYESGATNGTALRQISLNTGEVDSSLLHSASSTGPIALGDYDGDGEIDVFVGGRVIAGRYPEAASSSLLRAHGGTLQYDSKASQILSRIGMVSGAVFTDLNADGWPELVLACEWGPIRILRNDKGTFSLWDPPVTQLPRTKGLSTSIHLSSLTGWWNSVAVGDFDNDGRLDLVIGNWGRNHARQAFLDKPAEIHFGDTDGSGNLALLETHFDSGLQQFVPFRDWSTLSSSFPSFRERFPDFTRFSRASAASVLAAGLPQMNHSTVATFDSIQLLNRGDHFELRSLPIEAQFAPIFGVTVGDLNGDGAEDLFLAQNFFGVSSAESRLDAGFGLVLQGDGQGNWRAVPEAESGLWLTGEGRGAALSDFDHDGKLDIVVTQNRGPSRLFHNLSAQSALRIELIGLNTNLKAIGAQIRARFRDGSRGPVHEIHAGSGYWSQDSTSWILGGFQPPESVEILWPGGIKETVKVPSGTQSIKPRHPRSTSL